ncbi:MAG TPA: tagaturonate epimerase family protein [bacterium]|nr:tagaturonate epimerase family protein [bacterium]
MTGLLSVPGLQVRVQSLVRVGDAELGMARTREGDRLVALAPGRSTPLDGLEGETTSFEGRRLLVGPICPRNLLALRTQLPWLTPRALGLRRSFGFGDRLGCATPGHIRALRAVGGDLAPIFAQQSIREMERTGRSPEQVLSDATWGVFAEGWREGFGADADHLKTTADVEACLAAGYTFFTFDPGEYVAPAADAQPAGALSAALEALPWRDLDDSSGRMRDRYRSLALDLDDRSVRVDEEDVVRAAVKYGRAVAHVVLLYRHLRARSGGAEVEVSVDETETPTTPVQHIYIASELRRLGVRWVGLAPRFVGRFEKGVDYLGDPTAFEADAATHAAIARRLGPYKLSLHSGSDKLSVYAAFARRAGSLLHVKTAGTSYLEALRTIAVLDPGLFRAIYGLAHERYEQDRASYHVSARRERAAAPDAVPDAELASLLDTFDARQMLHVTFGSALARYGDRVRALLRAHPEAYDANLERHFIRHLSPLAAPTPGVRG